MLRDLLNDELISQTLCFLPISSAMRMQRSCRSLQRMVSDADGYWRFLCEHNSVVPQSEQRWKDALRSFITQQVSLECFPMYRDMKLLWNQLETWSSQNLPAAIPSLNPGINPTSIRICTSKGVTVKDVPLSYRAFCTVHNGQTPVTRGPEILAGLLGGFKVYDFVCIFRLQPLAYLIEKAIPFPGRRNDLLFPFAEGTPTRVYFFLDRQGRVYRQSPERFHKVSESFETFIQAHAERLTAGRYQLEPEFGFLSRFLLSDPMGSTTVTRGIRIQVSPLYIPERSRGEHFFAYRVRITLDDDVDLRCQLTTRHWVVDDGSGTPKVVDGPGVIGLYPRLEPGCAPFEYVSCTPIVESTGSMSGYFNFKVDGSEEIIEARIDPFRFNVTTSAI